MSNKYYANKGVERNKRPLQNIFMSIKLIELPKNFNEDNYSSFKFKDLGYITWGSAYEKNYNKGESLTLHGFITPDDLKEKLGLNQWNKFCQGKREFIIQRRIDGKNKKR